MNKQTGYPKEQQLPRLGRAGIKLGLISALAFAGILISARTAAAQSLAELLCAVQKRQQLLIDRKKSWQDLFNDASSDTLSDADVNVYSGPTQDLQLIDWGIGTNFPADSDISGLSIESKIQLLQKAYSALSYLAPEYFSFGSTVNRTLMDVQDSVGESDGEGSITMGNYQRYLRAMSRWVEALQEADWPVRYETNLGDGTFNAGLPSNLALDWTAITYDAYDEVDSKKAINLGVGATSDASGTAGASTFGAWWGDMFVRGSVSYPGNIDFYISPGFETQAISGLTTNMPGFSGATLCPPGNYLLNSASTRDGTNLNKGVPPGILGGNTSGVSINGDWGEVSGAQEFLPLFPNQTDAKLINDLRVTANTGDAAREMNGPIFMKFLNIESRFKPDFGTEFSSSLWKVPEAAPVLKITPDLANSRILVRLSNRADNQCSLIWNFALDAVASRNVIRAGGSGDWDAVYSGKPEDREPELVWIGGEYTKNGRWASFDDYVADWWRPVLKQLVCDTYGVDIVQKGRFQYEVDFYRRDQFGKKDATTGEYSFSGATPVDKFLISNPAGNDSDTSHLQIIVHSGQSNETTYNLTLTQQKDSYGTVTQSKWDFSGANISQEVVVTPAVWTPDNSSPPVLEITQEKTVVDNTTIDGVAQPQVTTTYWARDDYYGEWIDTIKESGSEGTRATTYTYSWKDVEDYGQHHFHWIDHLTGIQEAGGTNPYTADYDSAGQLTSYSDTWGSEDMTYSGNTVTRTEKINGQPVRTLVTTYSGDMSTATTTAQ